MYEHLKTMATHDQSQQIHTRFGYNSFKASFALSESEFRSINQHTVLTNTKQSVSPKANITSAYKTSNGVITSSINITVVQSKQTFIHICK